ncbi:MAG: hypothetical protein MHMPM18_002225 [Marteilia pararefringens]
MTVKREKSAKSSENLGANPCDSTPKRSTGSPEPKGAGSESTHDKKSLDISVSESSEKKAAVAKSNTLEASAMRSPIDPTGLPEDVRKLIDSDFDIFQIESKSSKALMRAHMYLKIRNECPKIFNVTRLDQPTKNFESVFCEQVRLHQQANSSAFVLSENEYKTMSKVIESFSKNDEDLRNKLKDHGLMATGDKNKMSDIDKLILDVKSKLKKLQTMKRACKSTLNSFEKLQKKVQNGKAEANQDLLTKTKADLIDGSQNFMKTMSEFENNLDDFNKQPILKDLMTLIMKIMKEFKQSSHQSSKKILEYLEAIQKNNQKTPNQQTQEEAVKESNKEDDEEDEGNSNDEEET